MVNVKVSETLVCLFLSPTYVLLQAAAPRGNDGDIPDNRPTVDLVPDLTAQPGIEDSENTKKLPGAGTRQPCGRVVGIIRRNWRDKQYCGSLRIEGDRAVNSGKGQTTSALFMPVDRKVG